MAKGKRTPALFEIINRAQTQGLNPHLQVPGWWRSFSETAEADKNLTLPSTRPGDAERERADAENYDRVAEAVEQAAAAVDDEMLYPADIGGSELFDDVAMPEPATYEDDESVGVRVGLLGSIRTMADNVFQVEAGRVTFSLSVVGVVVAGGLSLLILSASFAWGHAMGKEVGRQEAHAALQEQALDSVELARKMGPDATVLDLSTSSPPVSRRKTSMSPQVASATGAVAAELGAASAPPAGGVRRTGWNYLLIQHFRGEGGRQEAAKAERFVLGKMPAVGGLPPVSVEKLSDGSHVLLSTSGYSPGDTARMAALERFREQMRQIGKEFRQRGGGYDFRDAYFMRWSRAPKGE